ncbi:minor capsid protein [Geomicrobium sediminis]|uniref:SPP1 gp7 family putative phage head morphogenesis protein n=1 Tax=Geomicrobium sediminis TaxID=1347788 RepID=A0ABS2P729_9BACL|nr:minor capsid protein [Geomicrobium sediminis]MBM7631109.1 SPP1 gp7 family putative phage head morphogenesis protein [Geomicrobium sediminis]
MARLTAEYIRDGTLSMSSQQRYQVLAQLDQQIVDQARQLGAVDLEHTTNILKESYQQSYYRTAYTLDRGLQQPVSFSLLRPEFVEASVNMPLAGERFSDRIWHNKEKLVARTRSLVQRSMIDGADPVKLARELKREFGTSAYESTRLVRNEVARCTRMAQDQIYSDSQVVSEVMFDATLDGLTSEICKDLDGERYPIDQKPEIPDDTHVGCRSDYIPVVDGWEPSQKFDNEEKQLIDYSSYPKWAESQGIT